MSKMNCWEFKKCGREPGGLKARELGVCPAATESRVDGINDGKNGGRCCWAITATLCGGEVQGSFGPKFFAKCRKCEFYRLVIEEQGFDYCLATTILQKLKGSS
ncbi:MAG: two-CW domain-containing protein [Xenococcaceae cyanobacterium]